MEARKFIKKYPQLDFNDVDQIIRQFENFDLDGDGVIDQRELYQACQKLGQRYTYDEVRAAIKEVDFSRDDAIDLEEFFEVVAKMKDGQQIAPVFAGIVNKNVITVKGKGSDSAHSINEDEKSEFTTHVNQTLAEDPDLGNRLPIDPDTMQLFDECKDGLILSKLINSASPDTIDERVLNVGRKLNTFQMTENNNLVINSAKAIGCNVVNIGSQDLIDGREHLILGLIWQIIKIGLLAKIDIKLHPELYRLLEEDETLEDFLKLPADAILLRWVNYHLKAAKWHRTVRNFSTDVKDGENYTVLLNQLVPDQCPLSPLQEKDLYKRAEMVLSNAENIGCRKYLTPKTLVAGNPKLNLAFVAYLFNTHPGLAPLTEQEKTELDEWLFNSEGDREARAFSLWMNSLGVDPFVNNIFEDLKDGLVLLQVMDKVTPNLVEWRRVNDKRPVTSRFKQVENTNYVVDLGKQLRFSLVGIQGADLTDGVPTLTLGLVWQLMREHIIRTLQSLSKNGREITDNDMIKWANNTVAQSGKSSKMSSFKDSSLHNSFFFLDLLNAMRPGVVDYSMITNGATENDAKLNAKYAISIARKLGASIFLLPEDIVEVQPRMILTFIGSLMALNHHS
ncbi:fimbrin [Basidiobolus ranarum]|uniref:Fimbrin n=1 Tax=Basidiobolus ranarum TaxID=34480 RepID=A0ABR2WV09_9FUNG